jgi:hypothetical protein
MTRSSDAGRGMCFLCLRPEWQIGDWTVSAPLPKSRSQTRLIRQSPFATLVVGTEPGAAATGQRLNVNIDDQSQRHNSGRVTLILPTWLAGPRCDCSWFCTEALLTSERQRL